MGGGIGGGGGRRGGIGRGGERRGGIGGRATVFQYLI